MRGLLCRSIRPLWAAVYCTTEWLFVGLRRVLRSRLLGVGAKTVTKVRAVRAVCGGTAMGKEKAFGEVEAIEWAKLSLDCAILRCI